ncbi:hypothetical protein [Salinimicrobium sp. GXAS 041]|uniref:hypothetical protein n=1 Tax=Salinimicrobium sp. GXAS 041 TaxID=3400806 RepID=UPI003C78D205
MTTNDILKIIHEESRKKSDEISVPKDEKIGQNLTSTVIVIALTSFLGLNTNVFTNGANISEIPIYFIYGGLNLMAVNNLDSICGKPSIKSLLSKMSGGATAGISTAGIIAAIALSTTMDLVLLGGLGTLGALASYFINRKGKKTHTCGKKMNCQTWICPKCKELIKPSKEWREKDRWSLLDICEYLGNGGYSMNTIKSIAFLVYTKLLKKEKYQLGTNPILWKPDYIKHIADKKSNHFNKDFEFFLKKSNYNLYAENLPVDSFYKDWALFIRKNK